MNNTKARKTMTIVMIMVLFSSIFASRVPMQVTAAPAWNGSGVIVFDYSHGQHSSSVEYVDEYLADNLTALGYTVVWALGGINSTILTNAVGFVAGSIYGETMGYATDEITAIADWYNDGHKFMWIGYDSDYGGATFIHDNMTEILEAVGSHVYAEPTSVEDPESCCASAYRAVANVTSNDAFVADIVEGVSNVLMHGPTLLVGSDSDTPGFNVTPVALETESIDNVYPLLYYSPAATIADADLVYPVAHNDGDSGSFVAASIEIDAGEDNTGILVVSGASPYGDYRPMYIDTYKDVLLDGYNLVRQAIDWGIQNIPEEVTTTTTTTSAETTTTTTPTPTTTTTEDMTFMYTVVGIGAVVLILVIIIVVKRK